jgi:hypothetical protein
MWQTFWNTVVHPLRTFQALGQGRRAAYPGAGVLLFVSLIYTLILAIFIWKHYPAAAPSVLGLSVAAQYPWQIWYQAPLFFATTALTAWVLVGVSRLLGKAEDYGRAFGRISLATAVPFALTTMLVEAGVALLMLVGLLAPDATLHWLSGEGAWFASFYQLIGLVWLVGLTIVAVQATLLRSWWVSVAVGILLVLIYAFPVALFIR